MYGPEMQADLLARLQAIPEEWEWRKFPPRGQIVVEGRASNGALAAYVAAVAFNPLLPGEVQIFPFTDEDLEPFRQIAKDIGYPSVEHALSHWLETKAYRRADQCQALP